MPTREFVQKKPPIQDMAISKQKLNEDELLSLKKQKKLNSKYRLGCFMLVVLIVIPIIYFSGVLHNEDYSDIIFLGFGLFGIIFTFIISSLSDITFENDLQEKEKYVGTSSIKNKKRVEDDENSSVDYLITFEDWRIGTKYISEEYWNLVEVGNVFYVEQATNSGFVFRLECNGTDYTKALFSNVFSADGSFMG